MAVVHPLRPLGHEKPEDSGRVNVVRLVEFLGPISPELVLVDPELAPRARALLPELPWNWQPATRELEEAIPLRVAAVPDARPSRWRLGAVSAVAAAGVAAFGLGVSVAADGDDKVAVQSRPPVAAPAVPATEPSPAPTTPETPGSQAPALVRPRFVWPVEAGAAGYRVALYQGGRQIFEQDVKTTALQLPRSWTYDGRVYRLARGTYRWVVWPLVGAGAEARPGRAIVSARYVV